jgi:hypothetical protein
MAWWW